MFTKIGVILSSCRSGVIFSKCSRYFSVSVAKNMRFVQFEKAGGPKQIGAQLSPEGDIFEISALDSTIPNCMVKFLGHDGALDKAKRCVNKSILSLKRSNLFICIGFTLMGFMEKNTFVMLITQGLEFYARNI